MHAAHEEHTADYYQRQIEDAPPRQAQSRHNAEEDSRSNQYLTYRFQGHPPLAGYLQQRRGGAHQQPVQVATLDVHVDPVRHVEEKACHIANHHFQRPDQ